MAKDQFAFPQPVVVNGDGDICVAKDYFDCSGMTLRDYFAAKAMAAIISSDAAMVELISVIDEAEIGRGAMAPMIAIKSYEHADAMLAERSRKAERTAAK